MIAIRAMALVASNKRVCGAGVCLTVRVRLAGAYPSLNVDMQCETFDKLLILKGPVSPHFTSRDNCG